jgi:hypothetical protein
VAVTLGAGGIGLVRATSPSDASAFVAITPCRVIDTRPDFQVGAKASPLGPGEVHTVGTHGDNGNCTGIPGTAIAVSMNMTAVDASAPTFLTVWAAGEPRPVASSLNPTPGDPPTPNAVTTDLDGDGRFSIYNLAGNVHVLADINGYYVDHHHDDEYLAEVVVTEGIRPTSVTFVPEQLFSGLTQTVVTTRSGRLQISKYFRGSAFCAPSDSAQVYYLLLDDVPVRSSLMFSAGAEYINSHMFGVTEDVVAAGEHQIAIGAECLTGDPGGFFLTGVSTSSIVVIPD